MSNIRTIICNKFQPKPKTLTSYRTSCSESILDELTQLMRLRVILQSASNAVGWNA